MTRMFVRSLFLGVSLCLTTVALCSDIIGIRVSLGYHSTSKFRLRDDRIKAMSGPEVSADFPLFKLPGLQLFATPSVMFGGQLLHGSDIDGTIYRFMVTGRQTVNKDGLFAGLSAGVAHSVSRGLNEFKSADGFISAISLGMPLKFKILGISPNIEGRYYFSSEDQFRGITIGLSASF